MAFFNSAVGVLQTLVVALGAGLGIWGAINLCGPHRHRRRKRQLLQHAGGTAGRLQQPDHFHDSGGHPPRRGQ